MESDPSASYARWQGFIPACAGAALVIADVALTTIALPMIATEFAVGIAAAVWIPGVSTLAMACGLLFFGRLGDTHGRRRVFVCGATAFAVASVCVGMAPGFVSLILFRVLQGLAAAAIVPQVLAFVPSLFPSEERSRAFAVFATVSSVAGASGPAFGGIMISADIFGLGWRVIYLAIAMLAASVAIAGWKSLPSVEGTSIRQVDLTGAVLLSVAIVCLGVPLFGVRTGIPVHLVVGSLVVATLSGVAFAFDQRGKSRRSEAMLLDWRIAGSGGFVVGLVEVGALFSVPPALFVTISALLQVEGYAANAAGLLTSLLPCGVLLGSILGSRLPPRLDSRIAVGSLILLGGLTTMLVFASLRPDRLLAIPAALLPCGFGIGILAPSLFQRTISAVPQSAGGSAAAAMQTMQQLGAGTGIAASGWFLAAGTGHGNATAIVALLVFFAAPLIALFSLVAIARARVASRTG